MIHAYAAPDQGGRFEAFEYDPGPMGPHDVEISITNCGICHSDVSMWKNHWGFSSYPFVGGHEVAGIVGAVGERVTNVKVGDRVGLGWHNGYCTTCQHCLSGDHNLCRTASSTIVGNFGGFADKVRAQDISVIHVPDALDLGAVGPLLCGGITVFNPLVQFGIKPTARVAVLGIGGLGHMALQFARAWGCEVTAFTSASKFEDAQKMGAHHSIDSRNPQAIQAAAGRFDLILSTVNVKMDWNGLLGTLAPKGRLHVLGAVLEPLDISVFPLLMSQLQVSSSPVGAPSTLSLMMEFAARHGIQPMTEHFKISEINEAFEHLESGKARYRIVLDQ
jgi:alcohol/geraniol dehydrogenase (NADP+)